jgi:hypothetical protein
MSKKRNLSASQRVPPLVKHLVGPKALKALDTVSSPDVRPRLTGQGREVRR